MMPKFCRKAEIERGQRSLTSNLNGYSMKPKLESERAKEDMHDHGEEAGCDGVEAERRHGDQHSAR